MNSLLKLIELIGKYVGIEFESVEDGFRQFLDYLEKRKFVDLGGLNFFDGPGNTCQSTIFYCGQKSKRMGANLSLQFR